MNLSCVAATMPPHPCLVCASILYRYSDDMKFQDPLSKFGNLQGYLFNISALGSLFRPNLVLNDVRRTGDVTPADMMAYVCAHCS